MKKLKLVFLTTTIFFFAASVFAQSKSLTFDGTDDYVQASDADGTSWFGLTNATDSWTFEGWFYFNQVSSEAHLMRLGGQFFVKNDTLRVSSGGDYQAGLTAITTGTWYHLAYVRTPSSITVFLNGAKEIEAASTDGGRGSTFNIGTYNSGNYLFSGKMDEVRFWNVARTQTEIRENKNAELAGTEANLVLYYNFNGGSGTTVTDQSSNSYVGTLSGTPTWSTETPIQPAPSPASKSVSFNLGATRDEFIRTLSTAPVSTTSFTIEAWVNFANFDAAGGEDHIFRIAGQLYVNSSNNLTTQGGSGSTVLSTNTWYHIAYVNNEEVVTVYLNGVSEITGGNESGMDRLLLGSYGTPSTSYNMAGQMDEVRLWNDVRTVTEINDNKDIELTGNEANLVIYYDFNDGRGNSVLDRAALGGYQDGVLNNMDVTNWKSDSSPVPVELTLFTATSTGSATVLNWETATEVNNYGFEVQSSNDAETWATLGFVAGHGNSNSPQSYSFVATDGAKQYRLKQLDTDGAFEYSDVVEVEGSLSYKLTQNYPNPFNPTTVINFSIPEASKVSITVFNALGQEVAQLANREFSLGNHSVDFNASNLTSGIYFYRLNSANFSKTMKMMLLK